MKKMLYTLLLKLGIYVLEYALNKVNNSNTAVIKDDIQINKNTAKAFSRFIKKHTVAESSIKSSEVQ